MHPRAWKEGEPSVFPMNQPMGVLFGKIEDKDLEINQLGIAIRLYFLLLKCMIKVMIICFALSLPLVYLYANGKAYENEELSMMGKSARFTMGNLGQASHNCQFINTNMDWTIDIKCPSGSYITHLLDIGYQNKNDTRDDLQCRKYEKRSQIIDEDDEHYSLGEYSIQRFEKSGNKTKIEKIVQIRELFDKKC